MDNSEAQAFPVAWGSAPPILGMTKREYFAAMAMQGMTSNNNITVEAVAAWAVKYADALLMEMEKSHG
jgi:hypothetical protein